MNTPRRSRCARIDRAMRVSFLLVFGCMNLLVFCMGVFCEFLYSSVVCCFGLPRTASFSFWKERLYRPTGLTQIFFENSSNLYFFPMYAPRRTIRVRTQLWPRYAASIPPCALRVRGGKCRSCRVTNQNALTVLSVWFSLYTSHCIRCVASWASTRPCLPCTCASRAPPARARPPSLCAWGRSCSAWATADRGTWWWQPGTIWWASTLATPRPRRRSVDVGVDS